MNTEASLPPNNTDSVRAALAAIEAAREKIVTRVVEAMYADPFWVDRFGSLGRMHAEQDVQYHLDNLSRAVRFALLESPVYHYHWLQNVLNHRGICTSYLRHTIDQLASQLAVLIPESWPVIQPYIEAGYRGLEYSHPGCRELAAQEQAIGQAVRAGLSAYPEAPASGEPRARWLLARHEEALYFLSYLLDAVEKDEARIFHDYVAWAYSYQPSHGVSARLLEETLTVLRIAIEQRAEGDVAQPFVQLLLSIPRLSGPTSGTPVP